MTAIIPRRIVVRIVSLLVALTAAGTVAIGLQAAPALAACGDYVHLHRAPASGSVLFGTGNQIGSESYTGSTLFIFRTGDSNGYLAHFGDHLQPNSRPEYKYENVANSADVHFWYPGVSSNSVMRDDNHDYANRVPPSSMGLNGSTNYKVTVTYQDACLAYHYNVFLGYVYTIN